MAGRRHTLPRVLLVGVVGVSVLAAFWFGLVPQRLSPLAPISLDEADNWFVDFRLAALRREPALCQAVLKGPHIEATPIADRPIEKGCGWRNAVRVGSAGGIRLPIDALTCEMAAAVTLWLEHTVQPLAKELLGSRVVSVQHLGGYSCRNIIGSKYWGSIRSQHALANALDIAGFALENGRRVSVLNDWRGEDAEARFLRQVRDGACGYFRVVLSPDFNQAHRDHLHFDRGFMWQCK